MDEKMIIALAVTLLIGLVVGRRIQHAYFLFRRIVHHIVRKNYGFCFYSPFVHPFEIHGLPQAIISNKLFLRLPPHKHFSKGVNLHARQTSGIRIMFNTDSREIMIKATISIIESPPYCTRYGTVGFDIFSVDENGIHWIKTLVPDPADNIVSDVVGIDRGDVMVCLPQYAGVKSLRIGIQKNCSVSTPKMKYAIKKPMVFYGSSITQGASATRTGTSFPFIVSRHYNADYINFGFSASAKGEQKIAEEIAKISMSAFIMEYDHNADDSTELASTHFSFYQIIRSAHKNIPIVFLSRISSGLSCNLDEGIKRRDIIRDTYEKAQMMGDQNVYFIDGTLLTQNLKIDECLADGKHPNDYGMRLIADSIVNTLML